MPASTDSDDSDIQLLMDPRAGLRKSQPVKTNCDETLNSTCHSLKSELPKARSKLSLTQRKRIAEVTIKEEEEADTIPIDNTSQACLEMESFKRSPANIIPNKRPKLEPAIPSGQPAPIFPSPRARNIISRSDLLNSPMNKSVKAENIRVDPALRQQLYTSPLRCRDGKHCQSTSQAHFNAYSHADAISVKSTETASVSLSIPNFQPSNDEEIESLCDVNHNCNSVTKSEHTSKFSANCQTKEDFTRHWVDNWQPEMDLSEEFEDSLSLIVEEPDKERKTPEPIEAPSSSPCLLEQLDLRGMTTPKRKNARSTAAVSSTGKQTAITAFFTPCTSTTPIKVSVETEVSRVQASINIKELNDACSSKVEAKAQWSGLMSRMRGNAKTIKQEIKESEEAKIAVPSVSNVERKCPFYKRIPGTNFVVDAFCYGKVKDVTSYFLSHFHYDHYRGLGKWLDKPMYCSQVTARLVQLKIKLNPDLVRILPLNESRVIENVEVVLIDANHCPGSVMFLFRFPTGRSVLHVGDFRADPSMETIRELKLRPIDELYLDTTYCDQHYELPPQDEVLAYIKRLVRKYINKHPKLLVVSGTYTIGKEKVFMAAAEELDCKVWAPKDKRVILNCLGDDLLTKRLVENPLQARVHVVNMGDVKPANLRTYLDSLSSHYSHILALNPTGWEYDGQTAIKGLDAIRPKSYHGTIFIHGVPYSEHSGFSEMKRFVRHFRPRKIIPTVNVGSASQRQKMEAIFSQWLGKPTRL